MKCAICTYKEFSVMIESHHPIEDQPVIVCRYCYEHCLLNNFAPTRPEIKKGKRCLGLDDEIQTERI
jgi:hypothetical protein